MTGQELRRLDAEVAAALGWTHLQSDGIQTYGCPPGSTECGAWVPEYSRDIRAAWKLVEQFGLVVGPALVTPGRWLASSAWDETDGITCVASTACEAICKAVLELARRER